MTEAEIQDLPNRKVDDINIELVNEHFSNQKTLLKKVSDKFIDLKRNQNFEEAELVQTILFEYQQALEFYIGLSWKLRIQS